MITLTACGNPSTDKENESGEFFKATRGNHIFEGGPDKDTITYEEITTSIEADLTKSTDQVTFGNYTHTLNHIENLIGTDFDDVIFVNSNEGVLTGGLGCDYP